MAGSRRDQSDKICQLPETNLYRDISSITQGSFNQLPTTLGNYGSAKIEGGGEQEPSRALLKVML